MKIPDDPEHNPRLLPRHNRTFRRKTRKKAAFSADPAEEMAIQQTQMHPKPRGRWRKFLCGASLFCWIGLWRSKLPHGDNSLPQLASCGNSEGPNSMLSTSSPKNNTMPMDFPSFLCNDPSVQYLQVSSPALFSKFEGAKNGDNDQTRIKILCIILTQQSNHANRLQTILETWGRKCDRLVAASDADDPIFPQAWGIRSRPKGYWGIWDKLMQALRRVVLNPSAEHNEFSKEKFDWILKADDDTYVIMENLRTFLYNVTNNPSALRRLTTLDWKDYYHKPTYDDLMSTNDRNISVADTPYDIQGVPLIFGRNMPWPKLKDLKYFKGWFQEEENKAFGKRFFAKLFSSNASQNDTSPVSSSATQSNFTTSYLKKHRTLIYPHGGPGYVMNWKYAEILTKAYYDEEDNDGDTPPEEKGNVVKGRVSEDLANAATMLYRDIHPHSTFDEWTQTERSHPESPRVMYNNPRWLPQMQSEIQNTHTGSDCCSPTSISFHHMNDREMRVLEHQLYHCHP